MSDDDDDEDDYEEEEDDCRSRASVDEHEKPLALPWYGPGTAGAMPMGAPPWFNAGLWQHYAAAQHWNPQARRPVMPDPPALAGQTTAPSTPQLSGNQDVTTEDGQKESEKDDENTGKGAGRDHKLRQ